MRSYKPRSRKSHRISKPSRFDHRTAVVRKPATLAGQHISRKFRVPSAIADLIANLAGFGSAVE
jgi:hypothetical protein